MVDLHNEVRDSHGKTMLESIMDQNDAEIAARRDQPKGLKPHKCPVCEGVGEVTQGFYDSPVVQQDSMAIDPAWTWRGEMCRSCKGAGYLLIK